MGDKGKKDKGQKEKKKQPQLSLKEKRLASKAFDHLISHRGTKMAYTVDVLAHTLRCNKQEGSLNLLI